MFTSHSVSSYVLKSGKEETQFAIRFIPGVKYNGRATKGPRQPWTSTFIKFFFFLIDTGEPKNSFV